MVKVEDLIFPLDFMILDIYEDEEHPIILRRPFLATSRELIDVELAEMDIRSGDEVRTIKTSKVKQEECYKLEWEERGATPPTSAQEVLIVCYALVNI
jgi:hypothetical protein